MVAGEKVGDGGEGGSFGEVLRALRSARGMSQAAVASRAGLDRSYVNRLEAGERGAPAPPAVEALAGALRLGPAEADRLTAAAGLLPRALRALGPDDPTVLLLAGRLADPALGPGARAALRATVEAIVRHWGDQVAGVRAGADTAPEAPLGLAEEEAPNGPGAGPRPQNPQRPERPQP